MKEKWQTPKILIQKFTPNDYVSTCGKTETGKYIFTCDAPRGNVYYYPQGRGAKDLRGRDIVTELGGYHPCQKKHETDNPNDFYDGFVDRNSNGKEDQGEGALIWVEWNQSWLGRYASNWHASESLKRDQIEVLRS